MIHYAHIKSVNHVPGLFVNHVPIVQSRTPPPAPPPLGEGSYRLVGIAESESFGLFLQDLQDLLDFFPVADPTPGPSPAGRGELWVGGYSSKAIVLGERFFYRIYRIY